MNPARLRSGRGVLAVAAIAAVSLVAGCSSSGSGSSGGGGNTVKIGHLAELTGAGSSVGIPQANAIELAVDQINAAGGFDVGGKKYSIKLDTQDDKSDPTAGVTAVQKIRTGGSKYLVGTVSSAVLGAYLPIIKTDQNFITVLAGAAAVGVTDNISVYRPRVTLTQYTNATLSYIKTNSITNMAMMTDSQHAGYVAETPTFKAGLQSLGVKVDSEGSWKLGDTDFSAQLTTAIKGNPQALNLRGYPADIARIIKQARELGYKGLIIANTGLSKKEITDAQAGNAMTNVVDIVAPTTADLLTSTAYGAAAKTFNEAYKAKYNAPPGFTSASAYSSVNILVAAFEKAGTVTDVAKVRDALDQLKPSDVQGLVDSVQPSSSGLIFTNHQAQYQMVVRTYDPSTGDFAAKSFITGT
jgi:branched-chain amino acid transport system substrate-binding protein